MTTHTRGHSSAIRKAVTVALTVTVAGAGALLASTPAAAKGGNVGGTGIEFYLSDTFSTKANIEFRFGGSGSEVFVGDFDGDDKDTLAFRDGNKFYVDNGHTGTIDRAFTYGRPGDTVLVGDWNGDGIDTLAVRRGNVYHIKNSLGGGKADHTIPYGKAGDAVLVGDFDGDGDDTLAVRRGSAYHVKNSISGGKADQVVAYGRPGDAVYVGDFDGDGDDSFSVRRGNTYHVANAIRPGSADRAVVYGRAGDTAMVGDWNGDGVDSLGVRRSPASGPMDGYDRAMLGLINAERAKVGSPALQWSNSLHDAATRHSTWMSRNSYEHVSNATGWSDARMAGCTRGWAENIYWIVQENNTDPETAIVGYMNSPGHRANILDPTLTHVGPGTITVGDNVWNTQRFGAGCTR